MTTTTVIGLLLIAAAIALAAQHARHVRQCEQRDALWQSRLDTAAGQHDDDLAEAQQRTADAEQEARIYKQAMEAMALKYINLKRVHEATELGFLMPTVAGERAKVAGRGNVVPLRRGGAS